MFPEVKINILRNRKRSFYSLFHQLFIFWATIFDPYRNKNLLFFDITDDATDIMVWKSDEPKYQILPKKVSVLFFNP
mgnify:CR=1 FL=1